MKAKYIGLIVAFSICTILFYLSGAPLERGWSLFIAGFMTVAASIVGLAIGHSIDKEREENGRK